MPGGIYSPGAAVVSGGEAMEVLETLY